MPIDLLSAHAYNSLTMMPLAIQYTDHAEEEMLKAGVTRQVVRRVLAEGVERVEGYRGGERYDARTLHIENKGYDVVFVRKAGYWLVVTVYVLGEYD